MSSVIVFIPLAGYGEIGLASCEKYDVQQGVWKEVKPTLKCRTKFASVATYDGHILILGGKFIVRKLIKIGW